jgi:hypothetical protein
MRRVHSALRTLRLPVAAIVTATAIAALTAPTALAENPLYCNGTFPLNKGCAGFHALTRINEARNENGGCVWIQMWANGYGYSTPVEACGGNVIGEELTVHVESFPKCWNGTNANNLIHCRYALWST